MRISLGTLLILSVSCKDVFAQEAVRKHDILVDKALAKNCLETPDIVVETNGKHYNVYAANEVVEDCPPTTKSAVEEEPITVKPDGFMKPEECNIPLVLTPAIERQVLAEAYVKPHARRNTPVAFLKKVATLVGL